MEDRSLLRTEESWKMLQAFAAAGLELGRKEDDDEVRHSVSLPDGSKWIVTRSKRPHWQNAHFHKGLTETYVVQQKWMVAATHWNGLPLKRPNSVQKFNKSKIVSFAPGLQHNIYLPEGALIHTIKTGKAVSNPDKQSGADWWEAEDLDVWTKTRDSEAAVTKAALGIM